MKAKLLKKIRKRFKIIRVDKLADDASDLCRQYEDFLGLPFFMVVDKYLDGWDCFNKYFKTIDEAKNHIIKTSITDYTSLVKSPKRQEKSEVVWWNNK